MTDVVGSNYLIFLRGRKMRRDGLPSPPKPPETSNGTDPEALLWIGYRVELGVEHMRACEVAERLGMPRPEVRE